MSVADCPDTGRSRGVTGRAVGRYYSVRANAS